MEEKTIRVLSKYVPEAAVPLLAQWIHKTGCTFRISKTRRSKFGDYRPPFKGLGHRISVNHDLNPYAFLITAIHEFAHLKTWNEWGNKKKPHGPEWKTNFKKLMQPFLEKSIFPENLVSILIGHLNNPSASSCSDPTLYKSLQVYDTKTKETCFVENILPNQKFATANGKIFVKLEKLRTRYRCMDNKTKQMYLFPGLAEVYPLKENT